MQPTFLACMLLVGAGATIISAQGGLPFPYTWVCSENKTCLRTIKVENATATGINVCKLNCADDGSLWPKPTGRVELGKSLVSLLPSNITFTNIDSQPAGVREMLRKSAEIFADYISKMHSKEIPETGDAVNHKLEITLKVLSGTTALTLSSNESYSLNLKSSNVSNTITVTASIEAETFFGARHALETLSQLVAYDDINNVLQVVNNASITDAPVFKFRGVHLDTSRNYYTIEKLQRLIDGMSYNKLNMFHWHITDSHSFPMEIQTVPEMTQYGAYSPEKVYTKSQIIALVAYARQRGVKIIPELDQPAHSGHGYQWGPIKGLGNLTVCLDSEPWYDFCVEPPCGQLNIVNPHVKDVVGKILKEMMSMFDKDIFHFGGDEVDFRCYKSIPEIVKWMNDNKYALETEDFYRLWSEFQDDLLKILLDVSSTNTQAILWTSGLTDPSRVEKYLDKKRYIIQIWTEENDPMVGGLLQKGYKTIFSNVNALYLDCGFQAWLGNGHNWCSPIKGWQTIYDNDPEKIYAKFTNESVAAEAVKSGQILGSATALWSEQSDDKSLETRIWPRASAHAERLWTHPKSNFAKAEIRMVTNRNRMVERGIDADRLQPEFCLQFEGKCYAEMPNNDDNGDNDGASTYLISTSLVAIMSIIVPYFV